MAANKVSKIQERGQVTIPVEIREKLGLQRGDLVAFVETEAGVILRPQTVVDAKALAKVESLLEEQGVSFDDFMAFPQSLTDQEMETGEPLSTEEAKAIVAQVAGSFQAPEHPFDFDEERKKFQKAVAENALSETAPDAD